MSRVTIVGTGYVGLVTGVTLSEIGHQVTCVDIDEDKIKLMQKGKPPIYEPGLDELMTKNINEERLFFNTNHKEAFESAEVIYIAVGTPEKEDGSANLVYVEKVAEQIAESVTNDVIVVTKSTVPVGTNDYIKEIIENKLVAKVNVEVVSNPEFLREGSAIYDTFHGDRIVIGSDSEHAASVLEEINKPFGVQIYKTDVRSAEMIKYASNAFLATKISFINEVANVCERVGANIEDVAHGMGLDARIGDKFLNAGIGYGGSCFPKDTKALVNIANEAGYDFKLLNSVIDVNKQQQRLLLDKLSERIGELKGKKIAVLGLAFKPNTDDMREAASIVVTNELVGQGAQVVGFDPIASDNAKSILKPEVEYVDSIKEAVNNSDATLILTEWDEIKGLELEVFKSMNYPLVIDGRNCFKLDTMRNAGIEYHSIGRPNNNQVERVK